jgi:hypothetical protein
VLKFGGPAASFTSFHAGSGYLNLTLTPAERTWSWWGRAIFYVDDVDAQHARASVHWPVAGVCATRRGVGRTVFPYRRSGRTRTQFRAANPTEDVIRVSVPAMTA